MLQGCNQWEGSFMSDIFLFDKFIHCGRGRYENGNALI